MDRLLTESKLGALEQKSQNRPIRDDSVSLRPRDVAAAPKEQVPKNHVQEISDARQSAEFRSFFCAQTTTMARVALLVGSAGWVLIGAADHLANEKLMPAASEYRGLIAIPVIFAIFAASYMSLAQRYWQTFLSAICVILALVILCTKLNSPLI
jgi:hypothetical protein